MKLLRFVAALAVTVLLTLPAHAGEWITKEIGWQISSVGTPTDPTGVHVRDTLFTVIQGVAANLDTTNDFSLKYATPVPRGVTNIAALGTGGGADAGLSGTGNDTTVVAWIVIQADSAVAGTATLSAITARLEGKVVPQSLTRTNLGYGWVKQDTIVVNGSSTTPLIVGNEAVAIPIRTISSYGNVMRWDTLRMYFTAATGILSGSVRCWVRYWKGQS